MKGYSITLFGRTPTLVLTLTLALAFSGTGCVPKTAPEISAPMQIIFETDMGNDVDDALALDMLYKYVEAGKIDLVAIMTNKASDYSAAYIDLMNTWYGHPEIPIGILRDGAFGDDANNYAKAVAIMQDNSGAPLWPRTVQDVTTLPDAHTLYRRLLADRPDGSVTGLRARGDYEVNMSWAGGRITSAEITGKRGGTISVRAAGNVQDITLEPGKVTRLTF